MRRLTNFLQPHGNLRGGILTGVVLLVVTRSTMAQPPGSVAAAKAIQADYAQMSRASIQHDLAVASALAAPDFHEHYLNGAVGDRAWYLHENQSESNLLTLPGRMRFKLKGLVWTGSLAVLYVIGDMSAPYLYNGMLQNAREHFVERDTWELVGTVWMTKSVVMLAKKDW